MKRLGAGLFAIIMLLSILGSALAQTSDIAETNNIIYVDTNATLKLSIQ